MSYASADIGVDLANARRAAGLSQEALADLAAVRQATVSKAEHGGDIQVSTLLQLAAALDLVPVFVTRKHAHTVREVIKSLP